MFNLFKKKPLDPESILLTKYGVKDIMGRYKGNAVLYTHFEKRTSYHGPFDLDFLDNYEIYAKNIDADSKWIRTDLGFEGKVQHIQMIVHRGTHPEYGKPFSPYLTLDFYLEAYGMFEKKPGDPKYSGRDKFNAIGGAVLLADAILPTPKGKSSIFRSAVMGVAVGKYVDKLNKDAEEENENGEKQIFYKSNKPPTVIQPPEKSNDLFTRNKDIIKEHYNNFCSEEEPSHSMVEFELAGAIQVCLDAIAIGEDRDDLISLRFIEDEKHFIDNDLYINDDGKGICGWDNRKDIPVEWNVLKQKLIKRFKGKFPSAIEKMKSEKQKRREDNEKLISDEVSNEIERLKKGYLKRNECVINLGGEGCDYSIGPLAKKFNAMLCDVSKKTDAYLDKYFRLTEVVKTGGEFTTEYFIYNDKGLFKRKFNTYEEAADQVDFENEILVYFNNVQIENLKYEEIFDLEWLKKHQDLVDKFLDISERKVSVIDDYGEEDLDALWDEILTCLNKIAKREGERMLVEKKRNPNPEDKDPFCFPRPHEEKYWLLARELKNIFLNHHNTRSLKPANEIDVDGLSGVEFETWVAKILKENGFKDISGTPATGDQGADIIAKKNGKKIILQAKRYEQPVGNKAVQEVVGAVQFYEGDEGWVITNATFTPAAKALANKCNVKLIDGHMLKNISKHLG